MASSSAAVTAEANAASSASAENARVDDEDDLELPWWSRTLCGYHERFTQPFVLELSEIAENASGALSLAYVADGRLIGYSEDHMNAWDYLAGQLMVREAGGSVETQDIPEVLQHGGRVIAAAPPVFAQLVEMTERAMA